MKPSQSASGMNTQSAEPSDFWKAYNARTVKEKQDIDNPHMKDLLGMASVALTTIIMIYTGIYGILPILVFYGLWVPHLFLKARQVLRPSRELILPLLFVGLCIASVIWSSYREVTLRAALELFSMVVCTIVMSRLVSFKAFVKGLILGAMVSLVLVLLDGNYGEDNFSGTYALVGSLGSKNQVGFVGQVGLFASILFLFSKSRRIEKMIFFLFPLIICAICLYMSKSASSVVSIIGVFGILFASYSLTKFPQRLRAPILVGGGICLVMLLVGGFYLGLQKELFQSFGKDTTLTGRTYLWGEGLKVAMEQPVLGHGYGAFWVVGQPQAERYWFEFQIFNRSGFHFHNLYIQSFVDLGIVGFTLFAVMILANCYQGFRQILSKGADTQALFFLGLAWLLLIRAFVEVDFWNSFGLGPLLFYSTILRLGRPDTTVNLLASKAIKKS